MPKILAIDDKRDNLISIRALLKNLIPECEVITAESGYEGLKKAIEELPDTILLDIKMPNMDGYEVCERLKSDSKTKYIPVIMLTAIDIDIESKVKGMEIGADAFCAKPIDEMELAAQIKAMLRIKKAEDLLHKEKNLLEDMVVERTKELKDSERELRNLSQHLLEVREEERTGIARELHDELGQSLTALKMDLGWIRRKLDDDRSVLLQRLELMSTLIDNTIESVHRISSELRPGILDDFGLCAAIEWLAREIEGRTGIKCVLRFDPEEINHMDDKLMLNIFRIYQEVLTNVARHSQATKVDIVLAEEGNTIKIEINDNGKGITEEQINNPNSFGIIGIKERANFYNARLYIGGIRDVGTKVKVVFPITYSI
ncbi:MAG: response regulator [Spirochaetota bacterium]|nr:response regulator [Spirochaetota bacterium]